MTIIVPPSTDGLEVTDYDTLLAVAESVLGRSVITGALTIITSKINQRLRVREMIAEETLSSTALPSDFLEAEYVKIGNDVYVPASVRSNTSCTYAVKNGEFILTPASDSPEIFLRYYQAIPVLGPGDTSDVLSKYPEVFLFGLLYSHAQLVRDESGGAAWGPAFEEAMRSATASDVASRMDQEPTRVMPRAVV